MDEKLTTGNVDVGTDLGDPFYYTRKILSDPIQSPKYLDLFVKFGGNLSDPQEKAAFFASEEYLDLLCEDDFNLFAERVLGYTVKPHHVQWTDDFVNNKHCIILAPREHGKTAWLVGYIIWNAFYKKKQNIMVFSETLGQGKMILGGEFSIKEQMESNPKLHSIYPTDYTRKWSETQIKLSNGVRIEIAGWDQRVRGRHPDLIILDDVLSDQNSGTKEARKKVLHFFTHVIVPMRKKNTQIIIIGTAHHPDDLLFTLGNTGEYTFRRYQAVDEETSIALWPEKHSFDSLQKFRRAYGELAYQREYQNNPISDSLSFFPPEILDMCKDYNLTYMNSYAGPEITHLGGDLSPPGGAKKGDGDYTVYMAGELDKEECINILNYIRFRDSFDSKDLFLEKQINILKSYCHLFQVDHGFIEEVGFQSIYTKELIRKQTNLPIKGLNVTNSGKKSLTAGIPYIRSLMEKGKIRVPYKTPDDRAKTDEMFREFLGVIMDEKGRIGNMGYHDDCVTAMWMLVESTKTTARPPYQLGYNRFGSHNSMLSIPKFKGGFRPFQRKGR